MSGNLFAFSFTATYPHWTSLNKPWLIAKRRLLFHQKDQGSEIDSTSPGSVQPDLILYTTAINACEQHMQLGRSFHAPTCPGNSERICFGAELNLFCHVGACSSPVLQKIVWFKSTCLRTSPFLLNPNVQISMHILIFLSFVLVPLPNQFCYNQLLFVLVKWQKYNWIGCAHYSYLAFLGHAGPPKLYIHTSWYIQVQLGMFCLWLIQWFPRALFSGSCISCQIPLLFIGFYRFHVFHASFLWKKIWPHAFHMWSASQLDDLPIFLGMAKKPTNPGLDEMDDHKPKNNIYIYNIYPYKTIAMYKHNHEWKIWKYKTIKIHKDSIFWPEKHILLPSSHFHVIFAESTRLWPNLPGSGLPRWRCCRLAATRWESRLEGPHG